MINGSKNFVVCAREGGANTTPLFSAAHFAKRNTKFGGGGKRGRAKIHSPQPPFFLPARALDFVPAARSAAIKSFVQKRFERRSVIATSEIKIEPQNGSIFISDVGLPGVGPGLHDPQPCVIPLYHSPLRIEIIYCFIAQCLMKNPPPYGGGFF